jgi:hypothetical protein
MITDLSDSLSAKIKTASAREKIEIFIGTHHLQKEPFLSLMYGLISGIPYLDFVSATMAFMKNNDAMLAQEPKSITINETGKLFFRSRWKILFFLAVCQKIKYKFLGGTDQVEDFKAFSWFYYQLVLSEASFLPCQNHNFH